MVSSLDSRAIFDAILQSAAVGLFHSLNIALAPMPAKADEIDEETGNKFLASISFDSEKVRGDLLLAVPSGVLKLIGPELTHGAPAEEVVKDLANQLLGRIKNRVAQFGTLLSVGLPVRGNPEVLGRRSVEPLGAVSLYSFRTLRGVVTVNVRGTMDRSALNYSGAVQVFNEGDVLIF